MTRQLPALIGVLCLSACAAPTQLSDDTLAGRGETAQQSTAAARSNSATDPQSNDAAGESAATGIHSIEPPPVEESEVAIVGSNSNEPVCRYEARTGSHRKVKVCRTRAQIRRDEEEGKNTFETLRNAQTQSTGPLMREN